MSSSAASSVTEAERAEYLSFERQRQHRLLGVIVPAGVGLSGVASLVAGVALLVNPQQDAAVWINDGLTFALALFFGVAWLALRRDRLDVATGIVVGAGGLGILVTVIVACFSQGLTPLSFIQLAFLSTLVVLVGMLGDLRTILGAAVAVNIASFCILLFAPRAPALDALIRQQLPLLISVMLTYEWGVAALMISIWLSYRQTLKSLGIAFARAQQLDTLKAQFITHINHELRTPIMTLQGYVEYLRLGHESLPDEEIGDALDKASRTADTLVTLLTNILDIRRIESHESLEPEPVEVRAALDGALALIDPRAGDGSVRDLRLSLEDNLIIWGDPFRFQQILTNLLSNALKYSPPGTPIDVSGRRVRVAPATLQRLRAGIAPEREMVEIIVRDYGQGIPPDQLPLLFNRFVRLPRDLASQVVGSGLGLYLCRVFAETMGGSIRAESAGVSGEGSAFVLRLPMPPANAMEPETAPIAVASERTR
ncbi:MAG: hypothetical protein OJF49_000766 [Ktedonobacterales bacterium]|jgi:signal transduction histidine kinase|nr:MAG: hypothetical protein OJF49_000766 [Ktedonobacterales bacterium]